MLYPRPMPDAEFERLIEPAPFAAGTAREVFFVLGDASVVVKRTKTAFPGSNMVEWFIWNGLTGSSNQDLFARCVTISETGRYLMMERVDDLTPDDHANVPRVPIWLNDRKENAFGRSSTGIKIRDYGLVDWDKLITPETEPVAFQVQAEFNRRFRPK